MALHANVFRDADGVDCTNGGISSKASRLMVVNVDGPWNIEEPGTPGSGQMLAFLDTFNTGYSVIPVIRPAVWNPETESWEPKRGGMFGGNFLHASDSRFSDHVKAIAGRNYNGAVPIHDRFESADEQRLYST